MKKTIFTLIILLLTLSSCAQENNCAEFKTGEFRYAKEGMPEKIVRTENMQIETNPNDKIVVKTAIEWTSDCEYTMTYKEILNHPKDVSSVIGKKIYCEIVETNGNRVKVHAKSDTMDEVLEFIKTD
ncbi:hypothetical protein [Winogradskyella helgolandensis]|uniref:hypothetical protein n=1 Tax=Winogradskyella helgolandensis TaxID=2697010 RepID=UPI0015CB5313|nr:hypothetical protein [Winogradskyella helgolandensis]